MQCWECSRWLFFIPLPGEVFSCCEAYNETAKDINIDIGVSSAVNKYGILNVSCPKFLSGRSVCHNPNNSIKKEGEQFFLDSLSPVG